MRPAAPQVPASAERSLSRTSRRPATRTTRKAHLRRLALDWLEPRTLLALPEPTVLGQVNVSAPLNGQASNESSPSIAVNPLNPNQVVSVWTRFEPTNNPPTPIQAFMRFSNNGGTTWTTFAIGGVLTDPTSPTTGPLPFAQVTDAQVAFDRNNSVYVLTSQHAAGNAVGALVMNKFTFTGGGLARDAAFNGGQANKVLYSWNGDQALKPTLAVDSGPETFTDPTTGAVQDNAGSGNVYVAWATVDANTNNFNNFNPNAIRAIASTDGLTFGPAVTVNDGGNSGAQRNTSPRIAVSQGRAGGGGVAAGQATIVWDDFGSLATATPDPRDIVESDRIANATSFARTFAATPGTAIGDLTTTNIPIAVSGVPASFATNGKVTVRLAVTHAAVNELSFSLVSPGGTVFPLLIAAHATFGVTGANIGFGPTGGTNFLMTLDSDALRTPNNGPAPYLGTFAPSANLNSAAIRAEVPNGTWQLRVVDVTTGNAGTLRVGEIAFNANVTPGNDATIATTTIRGQQGLGGLTASAAAPFGIGPAPVIASDNTLGSFADNDPTVFGNTQGRLYVAYVARDTAFRAGTPLNPLDNTDIVLATSDNGGLTWTNRGVVNDDNSLIDGFSESGIDPFTGSTIANNGARFAGRPQFSPSLEVDQSTGTLVASWFDTRHDAARARVSTYLTTSTDGGLTFGGQTFANQANLATNLATNQVENLGPIPDNQSGSNPNREAANFGFGDRQGLAVNCGRVYAAWSSNLNGGITGDGNALLDIRVARATIAAGPRILDGSMGPVGGPGDLNTQRAADGGPLARALTVTFDRRVDPATFTAADVQLLARDVNGAPLPATKQPVATNVTPLDLNALGATRFRVDFQPLDGSTDSIPGTISYVIGPDIQDRIRSTGGVQVTPNNNPTAFLPDASQENLRLPPVGDGGSGNPAFDTVVSQVVVAGFPGADVVDTATVNVRIDYPFSGDLDLTLIAPDGTRVTLAQFNPVFAGGTGTGSFPDTTFSDGASQSIATAVNPYIGTFRPLTLLSTLRGLTPNGTWRLEVLDAFGADTGTFLTWTLTLSTGTFVSSGTPGNAMDQNGNATSLETTLDVFEAPQRLNPGSQPLFAAPFVRDSLGLVVPGPHVIDTGAPGTVATGDNLNRNRQADALDLTFDRDMQVGSFTAADVLRVTGPAGDITQPIQFASTSSNVAIPDNGTPLLSTITIDQVRDFLVDDLDVRLNITHPRNADLRIELISPAGTAVTLVPTGGARGTNFTGTTLDDEGPTSITSATASGPYTGRFRPSGLLSAFDGQDLKGAWTLRITDAVVGSPTAAGTLVGWSLTAKPRVNFTVTPVYNAPIALTGTTDADEVSSVPIVGGATAASTLTVPDDGGAFTIADLNVRVDLALIGGLAGATLNGLSLALVYRPGPGEVVVPLVISTASTGRALTNTVFDDQATRTIDTPGVAPPFTGRFRPASSINAALLGRELRGDWELRVTDTTGTGTQGYLRAWSLEATPQSTNAAVVARSFRIGFPAQQLSGTYTVEVGPNILSGSGFAVDTNRNAGVDALRQVAANALDRTFASADVPIAIVPAASAAQPRTTVSVLTVPDDFVIQDLNLTLNIAFANVPDLEAYLVGPDGTRVRLFRNVGATGTRANFTNTIFDDGPNGPDGRPITLIDNGGPPFPGRFRSQETLGAFNGLSSVGGTGRYTLEIVNKSTTLSGTLNGWSITLRQAVPATGLGEPVADRISTSFRVFTMDPTNALASSTWTAVGPASIDDGGTSRSSRIGAIAVDPSDPSGNTIYTAGATGGVWKTTNFLTTAATGPIWIPLTDFGPTFGINIGSIAVSGRNGDPNQSVVFASTGDGDGNSRGVGVLRSTDGGATWTLLTGSNNNLPFATRPAEFNGNTSFHMTVDPRPTSAGGVIVFAAMSGTNGGIWRSVDTGQTWQQVLAGQATDITLDPTSGTFDAVSNPTGNLQVMYAAIRGVGVFRSVNRGDSWSLINGGVGRPLNPDADATVSPPPSIPVNNLGQNPNGPQGRIALAKPALVPESEPDAARKNLIYGNWIYAATITAAGDTILLYVSKDRGDNWTRVRLPTQTSGLPNVTGPFASSGAVNPSNDTTLPDIILNTQSNYNISLNVDPTDPEIVYVGAQTRPTLIRVDISGLHDANAFFLDSSRPDGGQRIRTTAGAVQLKAGVNFDAIRPYVGGFVNGQFVVDPRAFPFTNLTRDPSGIFGNATFAGSGTASFVNDGFGATWAPFEAAIGGVDQHRLVTMRDPVTGRGRLIFGNDQGIATAVDNNGTLDFGIGSASSFNGVRNGNLQINQFYYGAIQPSAADLNGQIYAALMAGSLQDNGGPLSPGDLLETGDLLWSGPGGDAGGVALDQQGRDTLFQYWWACCGGRNTDIFQVDGIGRSNGLFRQPNNDPQWPQASGSSNNVALNPISGQQLLISSFSGRIYRTQDQGLNWSDIGPLTGNQPQPLDASGLRALTYAAPDPAINGSNTDDFLYAGAYSGNLWLTTNGGLNWRNIGGTANGLDGSSVMYIAANPARGSHEAYAVTRNGVYHAINTLNIGNAAAPVAERTWRNITGNLFQIRHNIFGDPDQSETLLRNLKAIAVDWRYVLPDIDTSDPNAVRNLYLNPPANPGDERITSPALYVAGEGGVFRSLDNGRTWSPFPSAEPNSQAVTPVPPGSGGGAPIADYTDLRTSLGKIDPTTGRSVAEPGDPNVLTAYTFGRGVFAIRLAPTVLSSLLLLDPTNPAGGSDDGPIDGVTENPNPFIAGFSQQSAFGGTVLITLFDMSDPDNPRYIGGYNPADSANTAGLGRTNSVGRFVNLDPATGLPRPGVQIIAGLAGSGIPQLPGGLVRLGVQATDQSGTRGNIALFNFTLDIPPVIPPRPPTIPPSLAVVGASIVNGVFTTRDSRPTFTGVTDPNVTVELVVTGAPANFPGVLPFVIATTASNALGVFTVPGTALLLPLQPDGTYSVQAVARNPIDPTLATPGATATVTILNTAPTVRAQSIGLDPSGDTGVRGDNATALRRPRIAVTLQDAPGLDQQLAQRQLIVDLLDANNTVVASVTPTARQFTAQLAFDLVNGSIQLRARVRDVVGNLGPDDANNPRMTLRVFTERGDYDADGKADFAVFRPTDPAPWFVRPSSAPGNPAAVPLNGVAFGNPATDVPLQGDFDGDGRTDFAIFRRSTAEWAILGSQSGGRVVQFGQANVDIPVPADYDGDGKADLAVFRPTTAQWFYIPSGGGLGVASDFGQAGVDLAIPADYDGDGKADLAVFRPTTAQWFIQPSSQPGNPGLIPNNAQNFGQAGVDLAIPADYDGDGKADLAVFRPTTAQWFIQPSSQPGNPGLIPNNAQNFGQAGVDVPIPRDYDGDGKADFAVFRTASAPDSTFFVSNSSGGAQAVLFGASNLDVPVASPYAFRAPGVVSGGVYRPYDQLGQGGPPILVPQRVASAPAATGQGGGGERASRTAARDSLVIPPTPAPQGPARLNRRPAQGANEKDRLSLYGRN